MKSYIPLLLILLTVQAIYCSAFANSQLQGTVTKEATLTNEGSYFLPGVEIDASNCGIDEANRLAKDGVLIGNNSGNNYIDLESGNILLAPKTNIIVGTHESRISVGSGTAVFIAKYDNGVVVYNLLQSKPKQVSTTVLTNKQKIILAPGRMLVLTSQNTNDFETLEMNCHCVAYQNAKPLDLHNTTMKAFEADFSIASALITIEPLKELTFSNNKQDKLVMERLIKGAVVLGDFATSAAVPVQTDNIAAKVAKLNH